jgi:hypothetical protein
MRKSVFENLLWVGASLFITFGVVVGQMNGNIDSVSLQDVASFGGSAALKSSFSIVADCN